MASFKQIWILLETSVVKLSSLAEIIAMSFGKVLEYDWYSGANNM